MSMYRVMQNPDTPDLPFAQSTMELATLQRSSGTFADLQNPDGTWKSGCCPTCLCHKIEPPSTIIKPSRQQVQTLTSRLRPKPKVSTELLALAGVLLLA